MFKTILYNFVVNPRYRIWRHILFILAFTLISYRQTSYMFRDSIAVIGNSIFLLSLITLTVYLVPLYANIYYFVPRYLIKKNYKIYLLCFFLIVFFQIYGLVAMEHVVRTHLGLPLKITSYNLLVFLQYIPTSIMNMICILATSVTVLFKYQVQEKRRVSRMEQENIKSELDRLKEQISPAFLSNILNRTAALVKSEPSKAYEMLMKLGQLLRYQLYDSSREKVLLRSEINFIKEYLELNKLYCQGLNYKLVVQTGIREMFISPLLFIPFIQRSVDKAGDDEPLSLEIRFSSENTGLTFVCRSDYKEILSDDELFAIKKRLELIYADHYSLSIEQGIATLQLNTISDQ